MHFYCNICDKEVKTDLEKHRVIGKLIQTHTIINPETSDLNRRIYDYVTNFNRKYEFYTNEVFLKNEFENSCFYFKNIPTNDKQFHIKHPNFLNTSEMIIKTISDIRNITYENYIKQPKHMFEFKLDMIIAKNPHLIISLDRNKSHFLISNYSHIPFNN